MFERVEDMSESSSASGTAPASSVKFSFGPKKTNDKKAPTGENLLAERDKKGRVKKDEDEDEVATETITHVEDRKVKG